MSPEQIAGMIDHTLLKPDAVPADVERLCREALEYHFAAVCVNPVFVPQAFDLLKGNRVRVCSVAGFPLGSTTTKIKRSEASDAITNGATEIDMVLWVGGLKIGDDMRVETDIAGVAEICSAAGVLLKVILETACLTESEIRSACHICIRGGANFVKTSTGFGPGGATAEAVRIMAQEVSDSGLGVKASGGIRTYESAVELIKAGATRLGVSAGVQIVEQARQAKKA